MKAEVNNAWPIPGQFYEMAQGCIGAKKLTIVLGGGVEKELDKTDKIPPMSENIKLICEKIGEMEGDVNWNSTILRGILLHKILLLLQKKGSRKALVDFLLNLLNNGMLPNCKNLTEDIASYIVALCCGKGKVLVESKYVDIHALPDMTFPCLNKIEIDVMLRQESVVLVPLFLSTYKLGELMDKVVAGCGLLLDYAGVGDDLLKEPNMILGKNGKHFTWIVSQLQSLLQNRKLQGAGISAINADSLAAYLDAIAFLREAMEQCGAHSKALMLSSLSGSFSAIEYTLSRCCSLLLDSFSRVRNLISERLEKFLPLFEAPKEILIQLQEIKKQFLEIPKGVNNLQVILQNIEWITKESIALSTLSQFEFQLALLIAQKISDEEPKEEEKKEAKSKKSKKKLTNGKGTSELVQHFIEAGVVLKDSYESFSKKIEEIFYSREFVSKINEETTIHNEQQRKAKLPKGTRDSDPSNMAIKNVVMTTIKEIFKKHGACEIDTPVFELKETLMGKYGEESKLIYDLADQGGEMLSLRYDLTVPFARYLAMKNIVNLKRFHIGKVYRRDNPQISKGRYREFYQCDYDIVGSYSPMIPEADILSVLKEVFYKIDLKDFVIIINHRGLLGAMVDLAGCDQRKFKAICSSIDKLDKSPWEIVKAELIESKGLTAEQADKLYEFTKLKGSLKEMLVMLKEKKVFADHKAALEILEQLETLAQYTAILDLDTNISFDLSLARGLDYYTGLIYEVKSTDPKLSVGSIAGGGRYDNLVGMFAGKQIPAVGVSFGIERIFTIMEEKSKGKIRPISTKVLVSSIGKGMVGEKFKICKELWEAGIEAELMYLDNPKPQKQLSYALDNDIPVMIWIGEEELKAETVKIKKMSTKDETIIPRKELLTKIKEALQ